MVVAVLAQNYFLWWGAQIVAVAILVWLFLRWRPGFLGKRTIREAMTSTLDARAAQIRAQLEAAEQSRREAERIRAESQQEIERARLEANQIVERASTTSAAIREDIVKRAQEEYERIVAQARDEIAYERRQAELALQQRAADIVVDAAGQIVREHLEPSTDRRLIDNSLSNLKEIG
jgi:F-type H+-transporting ATPase subunit b